jgi:hypothetical protein
MNDEELAKGVLAMGFGDQEKGRSHIRFCGQYIPVQFFVTDLRLAGALMQRCWCFEWHRDHSEYVVTAWGSASDWGPVIVHHESLPRAIIEACVAALSPVEALS